MKTRSRNRDGELLPMAMEAYTDGSCLENQHAHDRQVKAGFGYTVRYPDGKIWYEHFGPVLTPEGPFANPHHTRYKGAERGSSQTAELTGLLEFLEWLDEKGPRPDECSRKQLTDEGKPRILVHPDSRYAQNQAMSLWTIHENYELVLSLRRAYKKVRQKYEVYIILSLIHISEPTRPY